MIRFLRAGWRSLAGIVLSAALFGLYSRGGVAFVLGFVALVPWLLALNAIPTLAGTTRNALLMSIAFVLAVFAWFGIAIGAYVNIGSASGLLIILVAAPLSQPQVLAFALVRHVAGRRFGFVVRTFAAASAWVATEWLLPKLLGDTIGHGLYPSQYLRQLADLGGAAGLSFLLIIINECVAHAFTHRHEARRVSLAPLFTAAGLLIFAMVYGAVRVSSFGTVAHSDAKPLRIGMVQSNIVDYERMRREMGAYEVVRHVLDTHYVLSREAMVQGNVDALLWSETVYPTSFAHPKSEGGAELDREILDFVKASKIPLVFGTYDRDDNGEYNAAAFVEPEAGTLGFYRKTDLFLLTEYLPAWLDTPVVRRWLPWAGTWKPGSGARVFPLRLADGREIPVLPMICLDDVDSDLAIDGARLGGQVILGMSNDSWFSDYPVGANLHLAVAAFRSIETRLPQMRVTANGVSAVIDASGAIVASTGMNEQKVLIGEVKIAEPRMTLMLAWGNWVGKAGLAYLLLLLVFAVATSRKQNVAMRAVDAVGNFHDDVAIVTPAWRAASGLLRAFAFGGLIWIGLAMVFGDGAQMNTLVQMRMFAALVAAPYAAAWCILRAFRARICIENDLLVLEQSERRIEIPLKDIAALEAWRFPFPGPGLSLTLASGKRWPGGIAIRDQASFLAALLHAGANSAIAESLQTRMARYMQTRVAVAPWRIDNPWLKFVLFPLVPALPAFRLHQIIAFGGIFGEYYSYGLKAYLIAFFIWWASWAIGMVLFAALLRVLIESASAMALALHPRSAIETRRWLEICGRLFFYIGVPVSLLIRLWPD